MSYHPYTMIFSNARNARQFVAACDLDVMSGHWRCDNPHMDPRRLIDIVREQITDHVQDVVERMFEPLSSCYLAEMAIAAFTTGQSRGGSAIKLLIELDAEVGKETRNGATLLSNVGLTSYILGIALVSPEQRKMADSRDFLV